MFRTRKGKRQVEPERSTLDKLHSARCAYFDTAELEARLAEAVRKGAPKDEVKGLEAAIAERREARKRYYLDNGKLLLSYYDPTKPASEVLDGFFSGSRARAAAEPPPKGRETLLDEYLINTDPKHVPKTMHEADMRCAHCGSNEWSESVDGACVCVCGTQHQIMTVSELPSYREPHAEKSSFNYRRINHFTEILNQLQAKETASITEETMDRIRAELKKQRITDYKTLTRDDLKKILRKLGLEYEHTVYILTKLTGVAPPQLPPEMIEKMNQMFNEAQTHWILHKPPERKNFVSYSYICKKLAELMGLDSIADACCVVKTREKILEYDSVWQKICASCSWQYIPSS
jgi:hypothetical protein